MISCCGSGDARCSDLLLRLHRLRHHRNDRRGGEKPIHLHPVRHYRLAGHLPHCLRVGQYTSVCLTKNIPLKLIPEPRPFLSTGERDPDPHGSLQPDRWLSSSHGDVCSAWLPLGEIHRGFGVHSWTHRLSVRLFVPHAQSHLRHGPGRTAVQVRSHMTPTQVG